MRKSIIDGSVVIDSDHIKTLLANKYGRNDGSRADAWVFLTEVRNATGYPGSTRYADGLAMCMWPSQGFEVHGFEIKISRSDWLSELKNPKKADEIMQYCDRWWLVAPKDVLKDDELPKGWGFIQASAKKLTTKIQAPKLDVVDMDAPFVASLLRSATEGVIPRETLQAEVTKARDEAYQHHEKTIEKVETKLKEYRDLVEDFEKNTGITVLGHSWETKDKATERIQKYAKIIAFIENGGIRNAKWDTKQAVDRAAEALKELKLVDEFAQALEDFEVK